MRILNLYAGIGGNRKMWAGHEVVAVESEQYIAEAYIKLFPEDTVVVGDAHQYLLDHYSEFDFIWSSPPCPTHSKMNLSFQGDNRKHLLKYPDMTLYQEIIFLKHFYDGKWAVENVEPYYQALLLPTVVFDRHFFWTNFPVTKQSTGRKYNIAKATKEDHSDQFGIVLPEGTKDQRKLLRNAVDPSIGLHILEAATKEVTQEVLL